MAKDEMTFLEHLPMDQLVPIETVEHYTGLSKRTISKFANGKHSNGKKLPFYSFGAKEVRFKVRDVIDFVEGSRR